MGKKLSALTTESRNQQTMNMDQASTAEILTMINNEDLKVAMAVQEVLGEIEKAVDFAHRSLKQGGRLIYIGAGTSGRLGVLDAVECPPTFSTSPETVVGIMAGGKNAFVKAVEGAEDREEAGAGDLKEIGLSATDTVVGIAASGRTHYVIGALKYAREIGAKAVALSSNRDAEISKEADVAIEVVVGPEALTGSTRMKAATAHKMVLNMISTAAMVKSGKVYENLMVDVHVSNHKLKERAIRIIQTVTDTEYEVAKEALEQAGNKVKPAIVMLKGQVGLEDAEQSLQRADGDVRKALSFHLE